MHNRLPQTWVGRLERLVAEPQHDVRRDLKAVLSGCSTTEDPENQAEAFAMHLFHRFDTDLMTEQWEEQAIFFLAGEREAREASTVSS